MKEGMFYLPNIYSEELTLLLEFLYIGQAEVNENDLEKFLSFGKVFEIEGLKEHQSNTLCDPNDAKNSQKEGHGDSSILITKTLSKREANGKFSCDQCSYQSVYRRGVKRHQDAIHLGIKHSCDECPKEYGDTQKLKLHKENTHEGFSYECDQCEKVYGTHMNLRQHEREHQGIGTICPRCEESFNTTNALYQHVRKQHDGIKYKCNLCDFGAKRKFNLKEHLSTSHTTMENIK